MIKRAENTGSINSQLSDKVIQSYTNIYVNTQLFLFLMQLYFVLGDMFRLIIQPSSGQLTIERYLIILRPIWDTTLFTPNVHKIIYL